jgi:hypothetical protein
MENIQIKFRLNKELDKKMCFKFLGVQDSGVDFSTGIIPVHPELKAIQKIKNNKEKKKKISEYFDWFYNKYQKIIENDLIVVEKN